MDKKEFIVSLKDFKLQLQNVRKKCEAAPGKQVQSKQLLNELEDIASIWFEQLEQELRVSYHINDEIIAKHRELFGQALEISDGKPSKQVVFGIFDTIIDSFHNDLLVPVQKFNEIANKYPSLDTILGHSNGLEQDYLLEAIDCAKAGKLRAAIILGWCAVVNRLHLYVQKEGFDKFNSATVRMSAIQNGRYKRFNKKFDIQNLADLRMSVFDNDLLWVLEFMGSIDGNQHERLEICFTMRNTSAHPGEAPVTPENVLSYFSDLDSLILNNPKFKI